MKAGFPKGVVNIIPGSEYLSSTGFARHQEIRSRPVFKCTGSWWPPSFLLIELEFQPETVDSDDEKDDKEQAQVQEIKKMKIGNLLDRSTDHGPQNHKAHLEKLLQYCETGVKQGATLVYGGRQVQWSGFFMEPTVFTDAEDHMYLAKEESFRPIMVISKFQNGDIDGVLHRANNTEYGLASGVFTRDINKAMYVSDKLEAGTVFINTYNKTDVAAPFGGVKQSGFGKDLARIWKQPRCSSTEEWIKKMWHICTMEYYSAEKNNNIMKFAGKWKELENIILSEVTQTQKDKHGTTGKASTPTSLTEQEHQMNNVDKLTFQLQQIKNERDELRVMLASYIDKDLNNRQNFELEMMNMEHKKETLDTEILPEDISEVINQCKKLTEENVSYSILYSQLLSECTQLKETVSILREENRKLWEEQISLQESCAELKWLYGKAQEKIYDLWDKEKKKLGRLEERLEYLLKQRDLVTKQKVFAERLQHYFAVSQMSNLDIGCLDLFFSTSTSITPPE
ncbi:hypothetical protein STEG23_009601 [Scotinomys teguina]